MAQIQPYCVTQLYSSVAGIQQSEVGGKSENEMTEVWREDEMYVNL